MANNKWDKLGSKFSKKTNFKFGEFNTDYFQRENKKETEEEKRESQKDSQREFKKSYDSSLSASIGKLTGKMSLLNDSVVRLTKAMESARRMPAFGNSGGGGYRTSSGNSGQYYTGGTRWKVRRGTGNEFGTYYDRGVDDGTYKHNRVYDSKMDTYVDRLNAGMIDKSYSNYVNPKETTARLINARHVRKFNDTYNRSQNNRYRMRTLARVTGKSMMSSFAKTFGFGGRLFDVKWTHVRDERIRKALTEDQLAYVTSGGKLSDDEVDMIPTRDEKLRETIRRDYGSGKPKKVFDYKKSEREMSNLIGAKSKSNMEPAPFTQTPEPKPKKPFNPITGWSAGNSGKYDGLRKFNEKPAENLAKKYKVGEKELTQILGKRKNQHKSGALKSKTLKQDIKRSVYSAIMDRDKNLPNGKARFVNRDAATLKLLREKYATDADTLQTMSSDELQDFIKGIPVEDANRIFEKQSARGLRLNASLGEGGMGLGGLSLPDLPMPDLDMPDRRGRRPPSRGKTPPKEKPKGKPSTGGKPKGGGGLKGIRGMASLAKRIPWIGAAIGAGFGLYDAHEMFGKSLTGADMAVASGIGAVGGIVNTIPDTVNLASNVAGKLGIGSGDDIMDQWMDTNKHIKGAIDQNHLAKEAKKPQAAMESVRFGNVAARKTEELKTVTDDNKKKETENAAKVAVVPVPTPAPQAAPESQGQQLILPKSEPRANENAFERIMRKTYTPL